MQKTIVDGRLLTKTDYLSGFQYKDGKLQFFPHAEGYVNVTAGTKFNYVYNYTDHLGNVRVSYGLDQNNVLRILEESNYYPFGLKHENYNAQKYDFKQNALGTFVVLAPTQSNDYKYKYNGKELQDELGLNLYDYGARNYDAALGRWMNVDPLAETSRRFSPYAYALNNPVFFIDPDGMEAKGNYSSDNRNTPEARQLIEDNKSFTRWVANGGESSNCPSCRTKADWDAYEQQANNARELLGSNLFDSRYVTTTDEDGHDIYYRDGEVIDLVKNESRLKKGVVLMSDGLLIEAPANLFKAVSKLFNSASKAANTGTKLLNQFNSAESLIQGAGKLSKIKAGMQGFVKGDGASIFKAITNGGTLSQKGYYTMPNGTVISKYFSSTSGDFSIFINQGSKAFKIRITP